MDSFLIDTSGFVHLMQDADVRRRWLGPIESGLVRISKPTRVELLYSATGPAHRDELENDLFDLFGPAVGVPKDAWDWVDTAQYKLTQKGQHRSAGVVDLLVAAAAVHHDLTVLHVDGDFATVARVLPELRERDVRDRLT
ncbi:PIN domain-containing protein [Kitasatospora sp. NPDC048540]|uniref:PIN domain-containing protein n=1 Tax=unclassified Kitasatospora TaxID=2633591 RepID=UPI000539DEB0|nr:PIN domain-containing protein [Kitasatospora sp. MBT63]